MTASFSHAWTDWTIRRDRRDFKIRRDYNSRRIQNGLFGFGWCSQLDTKLNISELGLIDLETCSDQGPIRFLSTTDNPNVYFSKGPSSESNQNHKILRTSTGYSRVLFGRTLQKFNTKGQLTYSNIDGELNFKIEYIDVLLKIKIGTHPDDVLNVTIGLNGKITDILSSKNKHTQYFYSKSDLISVHKNSELIQTYTYDNQHNLTKIHYPSGQLEQTTYDEIHDRVVSHKESPLCERHISYSQDVRSNLNFTTTVIKTCARQTPRVSKYNFVYKKMSDGSLYLEGITTETKKGRIQTFIEKTKGESSESKIRGA